MNVEGVNDLFVADLQRAYGIETTLVDELETLEADANVDALDDLPEEDLRKRLLEALGDHREETETHVERVEAAFEALEMAPDERRVPSLDGLFEEKEKFNNVVLNDEVRPLFYLGALEQVERLEIDTYRRLLDVGEHIDVPGAALAPLEETLREEEAALETLEELRSSDAFGDLIEAVAADEREV